MRINIFIETINQNYLIDKSVECLNHYLNVAPMVFPKENYKCSVAHQNLIETADRECVGEIKSVFHQSYLLLLTKMRLKKLFARFIKKAEFFTNYEPATKFEIKKIL